MRALRHERREPEDHCVVVTHCFYRTINRELSRSSVKLSEYDYFPFPFFLLSSEYLVRTSHTVLGHTALLNNVIQFTAAKYSSILYYRAKQNAVVYWAIAAASRDPMTCSDLAVAVDALLFVFDLFKLQYHHWYQDKLIKREESRRPFRLQYLDRPVASEPRHSTKLTYSVTPSLSSWLCLIYFCYWHSSADIAVDALSF